jgi:hypothetical protein
MTETISFDDALQLSDRYSKTRHALLGNGFSIACRADTFAYGSLLEEADFSKFSGDARGLFELIGTADFEKVVETLKLASGLMELYETSDIELRDRLASDSEQLKNILAEVLAKKHPEGPWTITDDEYQSAKTFLSNFKRIYTVNYDLLLYWTIMKTELEPRVSSHDGFSEGDEPGLEYVLWNPYTTYTNQNIYYLHGALHIFDDGVDIRKYTWNRTGVRLIQQIRAALDSGLYPLVVTEGNSEEKAEKILHAAYLNHAIRSFSSSKGTLFIFGHSLGAGDEHVLRRIEESDKKAVFVSLHGDPESASNQAIVERAYRLGSRRDKGNQLGVHFFDADSARVWR